MLAILFNANNFSENYRIIIDEWPSIAEGALASLKLTQEQELITSLGVLKNKDVTLNAKFFDAVNFFEALRYGTIFYRLNNNYAPKVFKVMTQNFTSSPFYIKNVFLKDKQPVAAICLSSDSVWSSVQRDFPNCFLELELTIVAKGDLT